MGYEINNGSIPHPSCYESEISEHFKSAEIILDMSDIIASRLIRDGKVIGLQVYGNMYQDLEQAEKLLGAGYYCSMNPNNLSITII